jgi:hypothetical protein
MKFTRRNAIRIVLTVLTLSLLAFATATPLTVITLKQNNYAVQAGDLAITMTAMDATNGNSYQMTGKQVILFQNTDASAHTVTINSIADPYGRLDTSLTAYSLAVSPGLSAIEMTQLQGWAGSGNLVTITTTSALVKVAVLTHQ